jgi:cytochrome P450
MFTFTNAKDHSVRRRMFSRPMSRKSLLENWHDTVKEMTSLTVHKMHDVAAREGKVNMLDWWTFMAMDVVGRLMYGRSFGNLERGGVSLRSFHMMYKGIDC